MKKLKIGNDIEVSVAETTGDISAKRYIALKAWIIQDESGQTIPSLSKMFSKFCNEFDKESKSGMFLAVQEYLTGLKRAVEEVDPQHMMFALLVTEENEDKTSTDETLLKQKLERYYNAGLSQKDIETVAGNFLLALIKR